MAVLVVVLVVPFTVLSQPARSHAASPLRCLTSQSAWVDIVVLYLTAVDAFAHFVFNLFFKLFYTMPAVTVVGGVTFLTVFR